MSNLFQRASANQSLTPNERAILKFIESFIWILVINFLLGVSQYLTSNQHVNVGQLLTLAGGQGILAVILSVSKFFKAQSDPQLELFGGIATQLADQVAQRLNVAQPQYMPAPPPTLDLTQNQQPPSAPAAPTPNPAPAPTTPAPAAVVVSASNVPAGAPVAPTATVNGNPAQYSSLPTDLTIANPKPTTGNEDTMPVAAVRLAQVIQQAAATPSK
jgi:hypothetical protein